MAIESIKSWLDIGAVVLLFLTFVFGAGALIAGRILEKENKEQLRQFDKDLTDAKTALVKQQTLASEAKAAQQAVEVDLRKQEERAAKAEAELLTLHNRLAPREVTSEQHRQYVASLKKYAGTKIDLRIMGEMEANTFGQEVVGVLSEAKWSVSVTYTGQSIPPLYGITGIVDTRTDVGRALFRFLRSLPQCNVTEGARSDSVATITIGLKPPP